MPDLTKLILVKHASPAVDPSRPAREWPLSDAGRQRCAPLAARLGAYGPAEVVCSDEPKAAETGRLIAAAHGWPHRTAPDLHEHDRSNVPHLPSREFISHVELFFRRPDERVLGLESADAALDRFDRAVDAAMAAATAPHVVVVTHGTVIALYVARHTGQKAFPLWRRLGLPSFVVMSWPGRAVEAIVDTV